MPDPGGPSALNRVDLMLRQDCNIRCTFCYQDLFDQAAPPEESFDFSLERIWQVLALGRGHGYEEVYISGGEPTLSGDLEQIIRRARHMGYHRIKIMTNGLRLSAPSYADALAAAGLTGVAYSLHGPTARVHEAHTARPGSFHRLLKGLRHLVANHKSVEVEVNSVVTSHNVGHLIPLAELVASLGVGELHLQHVVPSSPGARAMVPSREAVRGGLRAVIHGAPPGLHISCAFVPYCWMDQYEDHVPRFDFTAPFLSNCPSMFDGWRQALLDAKEVKEVCETCPEFDFCRGFWRRDQGRT